MELNVLNFLLQTTHFHPRNKAAFPNDVEFDLYAGRTQDTLKLSCPGEHPGAKQQ